MQLSKDNSKKHILSIITITFSLIAISVNQSLAGEWLHDFRTAQKLAQQKDLPLLLHFHASWCGPCVQMDKAVLKSHALKSQFGTRIIAVKIDLDENEHLGSRFNVRSLPSDIILTPKGRIISRTAGSQSKRNYLSFLGIGASRYENDRRVYLAQQSKRELMQRKKSKPEVQPPAKVEEKSYIATSPAKIGLEGYSPIALTRDRKWNKGSEEFSWPYQGITYFLSNRTELEIFKNDPGRYAPQLLGCDPVILNKQDRAIPGDTKYGAYYDHNLYLFVDIESREAFKKNPDRFSRTMHVLKFDRIESTIIR
ncbi:MAG: thioredoxin family protein [Gimesia sp.]